MTPASQGRERLLTVDELAKALGMSTRQVYRLIEKGELPGYRFGRQFRFLLHEVLDARKVPAA